MRMDLILKLAVSFRLVLYYASAKFCVNTCSIMRITASGEAHYDWFWERLSQK